MPGRDLISTYWVMVWPACIQDFSQSLETDNFCLPVLALRKGQGIHHLSLTLRAPATVRHGRWALAVEVEQSLDEFVGDGCKI